MMWDMSLDILFLFCVGLIWFMIGYQLLLTVVGYLYAFQARKERDEILRHPPDLPTVTVLVPAHNEELVIEHTVQALFNFDYPREKLEVIVIDDNSTDATPEILARMAASEPRLKILRRGPGEGGKGKSAALNAALPITTGELVAVYDADNQPERGALKLLAAQLILHPELGAALGKFRTLNRKRNLLTRLINIEGISFQWIVQAGRWKLLKVATIPGTNFAVRRTLLEKLGGWDEEALTEDAELSIRVYQEGYLIKFVPDAVTWEQEPETLAVWRRQRVRWVRGNNYVIGKFARSLLRFKSKRLGIEMLYVLSLYYLFLGAVILSDIFFVLGLFDWIHIEVYGPFTQVWALAVALFTLEVLVALSLEGEGTFRNFLGCLLMYFTYCQSWLVVVFQAFYLDFVRKAARTWVKTPRFATVVKEGPAPLPVENSSPVSAPNVEG